MEKFIKLKSIPAHIPLMNIDTDMIIPKQFLKTIKRTGLGKSLFYEMRYDENGKLIDKFILNNDPYSKSKILIAGKNFGCGSSREHAPWALLDFGIRCVISTNFADIFYDNCFKNGILPLKVTEDQRQALLADAKDEENPVLEIDLPNQIIKRPNGVSIKFDLDPFRKECLLEGLDDISLTLAKKDKIQEYENVRNKSFPWL